MIILEIEILSRVLPTSIYYYTTNRK